MTGEELTYQDRQRDRVRFPDCGADLAAGPLMEHHQTQHGWGRETQWMDSLPPTAEYRVSFLHMTETVTFPLEGYRGGEMSRANLWVKNLHRRVRDKILIL